MKVDVNKKQAEAMALALNVSRDTVRFIMQMSDKQIDNIIDKIIPETIRSRKGK